MLLFCGYKTVLAQHKIELDRKIQEKVLNGNTGVLLVKTANGVSGIDPKTKDIAWQNETLKKVAMASYQEIPFTPLAIFEGKPLVNSKLLSNTFNAKGVSRLIVNVTNGSILFDSETSGFKAVYNTLLVPSKNAVLVDGLKNKKLMVGLYEYNTGKQLWENDLTDSGFYQTLKGTLFNKEQILMDGAENVLWLKNKHLLKIDLDSGIVEHEQKGVRHIALNRSGDILFVFGDRAALKKLDKETAIMAYDSRTDLPIWDTPIKILGNISGTALDGERIVVITSKGFNVMDLDGKKQWEKSASLPLIKKIVPIENGYLVVQEKFLTRIDTKGKKAWQKPVEISLSAEESPVHVFAKGQNTLYITPSKANVVSTRDGEAQGHEIKLNTSGFLVRNLKLKEHAFGVWYDETLQQFPVYSENDLYIFNINGRHKGEIRYTFDFDKGIPDLDIRDKGYFIHYQNRFYLFDTNGELRYKKEYPSIATSSFFKGAFGVIRRGFGTFTAAVGFAGTQINRTFKSVLVSHNTGFLGNTASGVYGNYESYKNSINAVTEIQGLDFGTKLSSVLKRYKKGQENDMSLVVLVPDEDALSLIQLNIDTGDERIVSRLEKDESDIIVDQIERVTYVFDKNIVKIVMLENH